MTTGTQIIQEVRDMLNEPTAAQWDDAMLRRWINEAGRDLARVTRHIRRVTSVPLLAGNNSTTLATDVIAVEEAWWIETGNDQYTQLEASHLEEMMRYAGNRPEQDGHPYFFTTMGSQPTVSLTIYPIPVLDGTLRLFEIIIPTPIAEDGSDDDDVINIPAAWYDTLSDYVEYKALRRDRDPRFQEALQSYQEKRDALVVSPDYITANRNIVPNPATGTWQPTWLTDWY